MVEHKKSRRCIERSLRPRSSPTAPGRSSHGELLSGEQVLGNWGPPVRNTALPHNGHPGGRRTYLRQQRAPKEPGPSRPRRALDLGCSAGCPGHDPHVSPELSVRGADLVDRARAARARQLHHALDEALALQSVLLQQVDDRWVRSSLRGHSWRISIAVSSRHSTSSRPSIGRLAKPARTTACRLGARAGPTLRELRTELATCRTECDSREAPKCPPTEGQSVRCP